MMYGIIKTMKKIPNMGIDYYITEDGRVFTTANNRTNANKKLHESKLQTSVKGYKTLVLLGADMKKHTYQVHRLVVESFVERIPDGLQVDHIDNNKTNNHVSNLRIVTNLENTRYKMENLAKNPKQFSCKLCKKAFTSVAGQSLYCSPRCRGKDFAITFYKNNGYWQPSARRLVRRTGMSMEDAIAHLKNPQ
jgi:hypothetical protein